MGHNNNRWRGVRRWADGLTWWLQAHHMTALVVEQNTRLLHGTHFASGAGVLNGSHEHSHFAFQIIEPRTDRPIPIDPWVVLMYQDKDGFEEHLFADKFV
jgi:hypothetical protein